MSSAKNKNLTPIYAFIQGLYWMNFAAIMGYSGFYQPRQFSSRKIQEHH